MTPHFALRQMACRHGSVGWREAGQGPALVLLHGIGSGAMAWAGQLEAFAHSHRVIAWDAPGYGESAPLRQAQPMAVDYADALDDFLRRLGVADLVLVGHSLGALVAAAWAGRWSRQALDMDAVARRVLMSIAAERSSDPGAMLPLALDALVLASPARGYGQASAEVQASKWHERVALIQRLGVERMALERSTALCAPGASAAVVEQVRWSMARVTPGGYAQAAHMLAHDDIASHLQRLAPLVFPVMSPAMAPAMTALVLPPTALAVATSVLCGALDAVTPPQACAQLAREHGASYTALPGVAHACYVEDPAGFNAALRECLSAKVSA